MLLVEPKLLALPQLVNLTVNLSCHNFACEGVIILLQSQPNLCSRVLRHSAAHDSPKSLAASLSSVGINDPVFAGTTRNGYPLQRSAKQAHRWLYSKGLEPYRVFCSRRQQNFIMYVLWGCCIHVCNIASGLCNVLTSVCNRICETVFYSCTALEAA